MNNKPLQHLSDAFNSIISMMLASLRVRGWRALLDLPNIIVAAIYLRRLAREFSALIAAFQAGTLPLPASPTAPLHQRDKCVQSATPSARPPIPAATGPARPVSAAPVRQTRIPRATRPYRRRAPDPRPIPAPNPDLRDRAPRETRRRP